MLTDADGCSLDADTDICSDSYEAAAVAAGAACRAVDRVVAASPRKVYAYVCSRMLTYAHVCSRMLTYAHVCWRMLTYADVC
jgi:hypothetical protein